MNIDDYKIHLKKHGKTPGTALVPVKIEPIRTEVALVEPELLRPAKRGQLLDEYCSGQVRMGVFADGNGGSYDAIIDRVSSKCTQPTVTPAGTLLSSYCIGSDKYGNFADGNNGSYDRLIEIACPNCGAPNGKRRIQEDSDIFYPPKLKA